MKEPLKALQKIAEDLRDPEGGCPWDLKQDHKSMVKHLIEEAYEVVDAIQELEENKESFENLKEELGDLLFQIIFHAQLAKEKKFFSLEDVSTYMSEKLIFRHPHVYKHSEQTDLTEEKILSNWEQLKRKEKEKKQKKSDQDNGMLSGIPKHLPSLLKAYRIGQKVNRVGFDWPGTDEVKKKIEEAFIELKKETSVEHNGSQEKIKSGLGDILFSLCQYSRHLGFDPEEILQNTNQKFIKKFHSIEQKIKSSLDHGEHPSAEEWKTLWDETQSMDGDTKGII